jgi:hypothetical protein
LLRRILYIVSAFRGFDKMLSGFDWMGKKAGKRWMRFPVGDSSLEIGICAGGQALSRFPVSVFSVFSAAFR